MEAQQTHAEKSIRYNVPSHGDKANFDARENFTLHTNGVTVYFDRIREERSGYVFIKHDAEVAFISDSECDVNPKTAKEHAAVHPGDKVRFSDPK